MTNIMEISEHCRLCLVKDQVNIPIFEDEGDIRQVLLKITACLPVKIAKNDSLPKRICDGCLYKLESCYQFWNTSVNSEKQLLQWLTETLNGDAEANLHALKQEPADNLQNESQVFLQQQLAFQDTENYGEHFEETNYKPKKTPTKKERDREKRERERERKREEAEEEAEAPAPKRKRRAATKKPAIEIDDDDDDEEYVPSSAAITKTEDDSEEGNDDPGDDYGGDENASDDNQDEDTEPGPSGTTKSSSDAPSENDYDAFSCPDCQKAYKKRSLLDLHIEHQIWCNGCNKQFCSKNAYNSANHRTICDSRETCEVCGLKVLHMSKHMKKHAENRKLLPCEHCDKVYHTRTGLVSHIGSVHVEVKYDCDQCDKTFVIQSELDTHAEIHNGSIECEMCSRTFNHRCNYNAHMLIHRDGHTCKDCNKIFKEESTYKLHMDGQVVCTDCNKLFCSRMAYNSYSHSSVCDRRQTCLVCGIKVIQLKEHMERHSIRFTGERKFPCMYCEKSYTSKSEMLNHQGSVHMNVRYQCDQCEKSFRTKSYYVSHLQSHSGAIVCDKCEGSFKNKQNFRRHLRKCENALPACICDICGKELSSNDTLKRHKLTHTGERPYKCHLCPQSFARQSTHKDHVRTHTKERPHTCPLCLKSFVQKTAYNVHMRSHNRDSEAAVHVCCICSKTLPTAGQLRSHVKSHGAEML